MPGPGCSPSRRNSLAASSLSAWQDQENTARTSVARSVPPNGSRVSSAAHSSAAIAASGNPGLAAARAAAMLSASGSRAHRSMISPTASGSPATRASPSRRASRSLASAVVSRSRLTGQAPSAATRPARSLRLVTITRHPGEPGSSGRTWPASRALSSTTSTRLPATWLRYSAVWACTPSGILASGTPSASRNPRTASAGSAGCPPGSNPRRFT